MSNQIDQVMLLTERGWRPYAGQVETAVYQQLECPVPLFGKWLYEGTEASEATCIGCERTCRVSCLEGFKPSPRRFQGMFKGFYYTLSPLEMVKRHPLLRVDQASYCLNVSDRKIYDMIADGRLVATKEKPCRVKAADIEALMNDFDE